MRRRSADHHPHHAGHRHGGIAVGENAKRGGPQPGQTEFSADQEKAMRAGGPSGAFPQNSMPAAPSAAPGGGTGGAPPMGGSPVPADLDQDGGI